MRFRATLMLGALLVVAAAGSVIGSVRVSVIRGRVLQMDAGKSVAPGAKDTFRAKRRALASGRAQADLMTMPGSRYCDGRSTASASEYPGPFSEPSSSMNSAYRSGWLLA